MDPKWITVYSKAVSPKTPQDRSSVQAANNYNQYLHLLLGGDL